MNILDSDKQNSCASDSTAAKIEQHRETLQELAESDLPCADVAEALLSTVQGGDD